MNTVSSEMNAYIADKLDHRIATATYVKRALIIKQLVNFVNPDARDFSFLNETSKVLSFIEKYENVDTRWNVLMNILVACKSAPDVIDDATRSFYSDVISATKDLRVAKSKNNVKTPKQQESLKVPLKYRQGQIGLLINNTFEKYGLKVRNKIHSTEVAKLGDKIYQFAREFQSIVGLALYAFQPALRRDYAKMRYATSTQEINATDNWMVISPKIKKMYMNHFKNSKIMGSTQIDLETNLVTTMVYWISVLTALLKKKPEFVIQYKIELKTKSTTHIGKEDMQAQKITRDSRILLGQAINVDTWRHLWESAIQNSPEYLKMTIAEREFQHRRMLHSKNIAELYNLQDPKV
jgi:hypothetical protein